MCNGIWILAAYVINGLFFIFIFYNSILTMEEGGILTLDVLETPGDAKQLSFKALGLPMAFSSSKIVLFQS